MKFISLKNEISNINKDKIKKEEHMQLYYNLTKLVELIDKIEEIVKSKTNLEMELELNFSGSKDKSNGPFKNIICKYKINTTALNKNETNEIYQIEDILNKFNNNNNNYKFLECMISLLNKFNDNNFSQSSITNNNINSNNFLSSNLYHKNNPNIYSSYKILEYSNNIVKGMNSINYIKTTSIGLLICGCSDKICLLNKSADKIEIEIKIDHYNIFEINQGQKKKN